MLQNLTIENIVLIDRVEFDIGQGLSVFTGETGAGKSIIFNALSLLMGERAEARFIRHGCDKATVSASFLTPDISEFHALLEAYDLEQEDGTLLLRRVISRDGKSKAFINDVPVSLKLLKELSPFFFEVYGQHDQQKLFQQRFYLDIVDDQIKDASLFKQVHGAYKDWKEAQKDLEQTTHSIETSLRQQDYLEFVVKELQELTPQEGEEASLAQRRAVLMHAEKLHANLEDVRNTLESSPDIMASLQRAERTLAQTTIEELQDKVQPIIQALDRAGIELADALEAVHRLQQGLQFDDQELERTEERLFELREKARKHHVSVEELPALLVRMKTQLDEIESQENLLEQKKLRVQESRRTFEEIADRLTSKRKDIALKLAQALVKELNQLKMEHANLTIEVNQLDEAQWHSRGKDQAVFSITTNPKVPPDRVDKVLSGGEMSRFMLALKAITSHEKTGLTFIFDEVDAGVGGSTASAIGKRLALIGEGAQVLCVTHQAQVASYASQHFLVAKHASKDEVTTAVKPLDATAKKEELARMLAGEGVTEEARAAAVKLMETAG